jgi:hypothetical protein
VIRRGRKVVEHMGEMPAVVEIAMDAGGYTVEIRHFVVKVNICEALSLARGQERLADLIGNDRDRHR